MESYFHTFWNDNERKKNKRLEKDDMSQLVA